MATPAKPTNGYDKEKLKGYIAQVEGIEETIASETGSFMADMKKHREDIREVIGAAKQAGIPVKALKAELKLRRLDRDKAKVVGGLETEDRESLEAIQAALGEFASTPLGQAALGGH